MRQETKVINIYKFEELDERLQDSIIAKLEEKKIQSNFEFLEDDLKNILKEDYNLEDYDVEYSLDCSQGDGVGFYDNYFDLLSYTHLSTKTNLNAFEKYILEHKFGQDLTEILQYLKDGYNLGLFNKNHWFNNMNDCIIDYEPLQVDYIDYDDMNSVLFNLCKELYANVFIKICSTLQNIGYEECYNTSREDIIQDIKDNDYDFLKDGSIYE